MDRGWKGVLRGSPWLWGHGHWSPCLGGYVCQPAGGMDRSLVWWPSHVYNSHLPVITIAALKNLPSAAQLNETHNEIGFILQANYTFLFVDKLKTLSETLLTMSSIFQNSGNGQMISQLQVSGSSLWHERLWEYLLGRVWEFIAALWQSLQNS